MIRSALLAVGVMLMLAGCVIVPRGWHHSGHGGYSDGGHGGGGHHGGHHGGRRGGHYRR